MIRTLLRLSVASAAVLAVTTLVAAGAGTDVNVYNWSDYIDESIIDGLHQGDRASRSSTTSSIPTRSWRPSCSQAAAATTSWCRPHNFLARQIQAGVFQKLDKSKLPNLVQYVGHGLRARPPNTTPATSIPSTTCGARSASATTRRRSRRRSAWTRSTAGTSSSSPRTSRSSPAAASTSSIRRPTSFRRRSNISGLDPESKSPEDLAKVEASAAGDPSAYPQVPFLRIHQRAGQRRHLPGGRLVGRRLPGPRPCRRGGTGRRGGLRGAQEGAEMWFDQMAIPADAQHVAEAHEFLNYMMKPEVAAKASNYRLFRQRQQGVAAVHRQGGPGRSGDLSGRGDAGQDCSPSRPTIPRRSAR